MVILASRVASLSFLFCFLLFSVTGLRLDYAVFLRFSCLLSTFTTMFSYSPFLHFCDIGDSAARRQPLQRREASPRGFK